MSILLDPLKLYARNQELTANSSPDSSVVTARLENTKVGLCPFCSTVMQVVKLGVNTASEVPVYVCMTHRVAMPLADGTQ